MSTTTNKVFLSLQMSPNYVSNCTWVFCYWFLSDIEVRFTQTYIYRVNKWPVMYILLTSFGLFDLRSFMFFTWDFQLESGHVKFCQDSGPIGLTYPQIIKIANYIAPGWWPFWILPIWRPVMRPSEIQTVWHGRPLGQIWCFWENLNQNIPNTPDH